MKNRILSRLLSLGTAVLFAAGMITGAGGYKTLAYGADYAYENTGITIKQSALWTDEENVQGELTVEIFGIREWLEINQKGENTGAAEENPEEADAAPIPTPVENFSGETETEENTIEKVPEEPENTKAEEEIPGGETENENLHDFDTESAAEYEGNLATETDKETEHNNEAEQNKVTEQYKVTEQNNEAEQNKVTEQNEAAEQNNGAGQSKITEQNKATKQSRVTGQNKAMEQTQVTETARLELPEENFAEKAGKAEAITAVPAFWKQKGNTSVRSLEFEESSGFGDADGEVPELMLTTRISHYFTVDEETLPKGSSMQEMMFPGENGELEAGTAILCPVTAESTEETSVIVKIPLTLKEEYRYLENPSFLPVVSLPTDKKSVQETQGKEEISGGTCLTAVNGDQWEVLARAEEEIVLEKAATPADYTISVKTEPEAPKAGQILNYYITVTNTGKQPLPLVSLESSLNPEGLSGSWSKDKGEETDISGRKAIFTNLGIGETRQLNYQVKLLESLAEPVINTITAQAQKTAESENVVVRGASLKTMVTALKADFSVNKSADRTTAAPGDTITYQICIRNTGEKTLHSVLSTERFQAENISAAFVEKEGVILNNTKTQALISEIPPGEVFSLDAVVTLPENLSSGELINQVLVRTKETGEKIVQSQAGIKILGLSPTPTPAQISGSGYEENSYGGASPVSDSPKTSDDTNMAFWAGLLGMAGLILLVVLRYRHSHHME